MTVLRLQYLGKLTSFTNSHSSDRGRAVSGISDLAHKTWRDASSTLGRTTVERSEHEPYEQTRSSLASTLTLVRKTRIEHQWSLMRCLWISFSEASI